MKLFLDDRLYMIKDLSREDVKALKKMIESANLPERQQFDGMKRQIDAMEKASFV